MDTRPQAAGSLKMLIGALTLVLTSAGINLSAEYITLSPESAWTLVAGACLYIMASTAQGILSMDRLGGSWRTTVAAIAKGLMGTIATILTTQGIDFQTGGISLGHTSETWIGISTVGYFLLSALQAWLSQDALGGTGQTTLVGLIKAGVGITGTLLMMIGVDITAGTPSVSSMPSTIGAGVLYGIYLLFSWIQAMVTGPRPKEMGAFGGATAS